ncbi:MAG TPA: signal peptide peptidase SppA [Chitinophagaceae bacterium]|nr:signal peptide peptidase SppA [Chitinophagaceae bacterium]
MRGFFKMLLASFLALVIFMVIGIFFMIVWISALSSADKVRVGSNAVLVLDLSVPYQERLVDNPLADFGSDQYDIPGLYDVVRILRKATEDSAVKGIYIKCNNNSNGFAASEEIRTAIQDFKKSGRFVYAYGDVITQMSYYVGSVADHLYCNPKGGVDWRGFAFQLAFLKKTMEKLEIQPQIFYAGKFKSATEPFREEKMTEPNRVQMKEILEDIYSHFLMKVSESRKIDTATLRDFADNNNIQFANDALQYKLVDGLKYDDEIKDEIKLRLKLREDQSINFLQLEKYAKAVNFKASGKERIALIYAQGDIVNGKGEEGQIGSSTYRNLIRKAREDKNIKAIVIRVNSGGGSSLASENIWREMTLARKEKPVVVSFGDVAASGGYYLACNADSIFAQPNTITGSIGVFAMIPNMEKFFGDKLGITFDVVKTSSEADGFTLVKPLSEKQKQFIQNEIDTIYHDFKTRVSEGRKKNMNYVDSIAQGRIWSGNRGLQLGLVDRIGGVQDAVDCAARMAKVTDYRLREFPEPQSFFEKVFGGYNQTYKSKAIKEELGEEGHQLYKTIKRVKAMVGIAQTRMPFDFTIN